MPVLIISAAERERIAEIIAYAKAHPISLDMVREGAMDDTDELALKDRKPGFERPPSQHIVFPGGFRAAFSIEVQPPGLCTHLSISVDRRTKSMVLPSVEAVAMIAREFGVEFPADKMWREEFEPGQWAINLLSLYAPTPEGRA